MPEIDVQELDLLGEHQDCPASGLELVAAVRGETLAPSAQGLKLFLVQPVPQSACSLRRRLRLVLAGGVPAATWQMRNSDDPCCTPQATALKPHISGHK